jgi:hypothetical protein
LEKMCWLQRGVRWRLTCASKCLAITVFKKKSVPVIFEPPCICWSNGPPVFICWCTAKFISLTPLPLLSSCKLWPTTTVLAQLSFPTLALKSPIMIFMSYEDSECYVPSNFS